MNGVKQEKSVRSWRPFVWGYGGSLVAIVAFAFAPLAMALAAGLIANATGCQLDEANPHPCMALGQDVGGLLYTMFVGGWLSIFTLAIGGACLMVWVATLFGHLVWMAVRRRRTGASSCGSNK